ncbi:H-2 class I histocompatibility antigen, alpha chain-like [Tachyglossus aculeatus]|uniref:H-2 class I histocompatibility antigen, alpha chain-like n=1 Tax=Tachyglossus aculeatus TaxID=9261 RepID=UPI0018F76DDF|nr:H-2 class I histocompatibility antigen, alpha chain-like [Tachyglossus aculeatus]
MNHPHGISSKLVAIRGQDLHALASLRAKRGLSPDAKALNTKHKWEANRTIGKWKKAYLEDDALDALGRYLRFGRPSLIWADPHLVQVTRHPSPDGDDVTLRCWALDFYPADIKFKWEREGEDISQEMEYMHTRPSGDSNFQKWASLRVPQGKEQKYVCIMDHDGLDKLLAVRWDPSTSLSPSQFSMLIEGAEATILITGVIIMVGVVMWRKEKLTGKGWNHSPASSDSTLPMIDPDLGSLPHGTEGSGCPTLPADHIPTLSHTQPKGLDTPEDDYSSARPPAALDT